MLLTCYNTACGGIREPNAVAFSSYCNLGYAIFAIVRVSTIIASGASFLVCSIARAVYIYIIVRTSFRKCTPFLNSEYNFQFYRRVIINLQQYRVRRNPRAQRCSVLVYFRPYVVHVPLTRYAQTSDRPVEVQWSI